MNPLEQELAKLKARVRELEARAVTYQKDDAGAALLRWRGSTVDASDMTTQWRAIRGWCGATGGTIAGIEYYPNEAGGVNASTVGAAQGIAPIRLAASDYAVPGKQTRLKLRTLVLTNGTSTGVNWTFGLYNVTASHGAAGLNGITLAATPETGSTFGLTNPATNTIHSNSGSQFDFPASDGYYIPGFEVSGGQAANSRVSYVPILMVSYTDL